MTNFTTDTYQMKREILTLSNKFSKGLKRPGKKFVADMNYGMLASGSCLLSDIADSLHETIQKKNTVERLSKHLSGIDTKPIWANYIRTIKKWLPENPVIHIDDSDITKPDGFKFESLGFVRDGSKSSKTKNVYEKGYHVTEACAILENGHPVSVFSKIHSSNEKGFKSTNAITFSAIQRAVSLFGKATFVMDRGYDDNKMFLKLDNLRQNYVIRLTAKRNLFYNKRWIPATELRNRRKGKVRIPVLYKGKEREAYLSHVKVQITASRKDIYLVLVYGLTDSPMMLATNKEIKSKDDVMSVARLYFSRWRIEEYFRCKKQAFRFEGFRVRSLKSINALNLMITCCMAFLAHMSMKKESDAVKVKILKYANPIRKKVYFFYYRLAKGITGILSYAREGIRLWFRTKRPKYRQLHLKLRV
jgi:hypothetical protein